MNVSIIIPAYNAAETIAETLESVLAQTCRNWEAIVVDDGSADATAEIARGFAERDSRIRVIRQPHASECVARNAGIDLALYDWLLFLDADDWILPSHIQWMTEALNSDPRLDAVHCGWARVAPDGWPVVQKCLPPSGDMFSTLALQCVFPIHACIVRRSLVEAVGLFDTSLRTCEDWDLWQRIARAGACFGAVREVLALYRMRPNSASLNVDQLLSDSFRVIKQGRSPDPRVSNPHPAYAGGLPLHLALDKEFYLLCWCAGLALSNGQDARSLLSALKENCSPQLDPGVVAQIIFDSVPRATCRSPDAWIELWPGVEQRIYEFLLALEEQARAPRLACRALNRLKRMIQRRSRPWWPIIERLEAEIFAPRNSKCRKITAPFRTAYILVVLARRALRRNQ